MYILDAVIVVHYLIIHPDSVCFVILCSGELYGFIPLDMKCECQCKSKIFNVNRIAQLLRSPRKQVQTFFPVYQ